MANRSMYKQTNSPAWRWRFPEHTAGSSPGFLAALPSPPGPFKGLLISPGVNFRNVLGMRSNPRCVCSIPAASHRRNSPACSGRTRTAAPPHLSHPPAPRFQRGTSRSRLLPPPRPRIPGHLLLQLSRLLPAPSAPSLQPLCPLPPLCPSAAARGLRSLRRGSRWARRGGRAARGSGAGAEAAAAPCVSRCVTAAATPPAPAPPRLRTALRAGGGGHGPAWPGGTCWSRSSPARPGTASPTPVSRLAATRPPPPAPSRSSGAIARCLGGPASGTERRRVWSAALPQRRCPWGARSPPEPAPPPSAAAAERRAGPAQHPLPAGRAAAAGPSRPPAAAWEGRGAGGSGASARVGATA